MLQCFKKENYDDFDLHSVITVPQDAIMMILLCWIKPEIELLFPSCTDTSIGIDICLNNPIISLVMTKKFNIYLIMVVRELICICQLKISLVSFFTNHNNLYAIATITNILVIRQY